MIQNLRRRSGVQLPLSTRRLQKSAADARQNYERYLARAREAQRSGDEIDTENYYQHAEHYFRMIRGEEDEPRV
jgi:hypothetical protein